MKPFDYVVPSSLEEALSALRDGARPIAGGQSLLLEMKERRSTPSRLVSLTALPELCRWSIADGGELVIGSGTSYATLSEAALPGWQKVVAETAGDLADRSVRTMGTIGGALCQADPRFDMVTLAVGLDAQLDIVSTDGSRAVPAARLFREEGGVDLQAGEILATVRFPPLERYTSAAFVKVRHRVFDAALASAVCALRVDSESRIADARLVIGAASPSPIVVEQAQGLLAAGAPGAEQIEAAAAAATTALDAMALADTRQTRYQRELVPVVVGRAISDALDRSRS